MDILNWLTDSVKNLYWFKTQHEARENMYYVGEFRNTADELGKQFNKAVWTKEDYLKWTFLWKATYKKLSEESRMCKQNRKATAVGVFVSSENIERVRALREIASRLMDQRRFSKERAEESFKAERLIAA